MARLALAMAACLAIAGCRGDPAAERPAEPAPATPGPERAARAPRAPIQAAVEGMVAELRAARTPNLFGAIGDAARSRGLGVASLGGLDQEALPGMLEAGDVLDGGGDRVVIFAGVDRDGVHLIDPVSGPRVMDPGTFRLEFAGRHAFIIGASQADMDARWDALFPRATRRP